jgi:hypothetical protein
MSKTRYYIRLNVSQRNKTSKPTQTLPYTGRSFDGGELFITIFYLESSLKEKDWKLNKINNCAHLKI